MGLIAIIIAQVAPGLKVVGGNIGKRRRPKLRMVSEKTCNLGCIEITDNALAAAPVIAVAIFRNQVPPETHLSCQRRPQLLQQVLAPGFFSSLPNVTRIFV